MKFLDQAKIYLKSGDGGRGCLSFRREKFIDMGGPDGGNGGKGGSIYITAVQNMNTLIDFRYQQHFTAENGRPGEGANRSGRDGKDLLIRVPVGTEILSDDKETVIADMTEDGQTLMLAKGGDGGFGNAHFKSSTNQAPRKTLPGWPGEELSLWLRLKLIADAGLVGMPNAGKSTFLSICTKARPKIANYPFTTLHPNLGVVYLDGNEFILADIPGLIEGAHEGHGLGDRFLGHIERTSVLLHLIDATEEDVVKSYKTISNELKAYGGGIAKKPEIIALNKCDALLPEEAEEKRAKLAKAIRKKVYAISAVSGDQVEPVLYEVLKHIQQAKKSAPKDE